MPASFHVIDPTSLYFLNFEPQWMQAIEDLITGAMGVAGATDGMIDVPTTMAGTTEATNREIIIMK
jgi:hypothetical protein